MSLSRRCCFTAHERHKTTRTPSIPNSAILRNSRLLTAEILRDLLRHQVICSRRRLSDLPQQISTGVVTRLSTPTARLATPTTKPSSPRIRLATPTTRPSSPTIRLSIATIQSSIKHIQSFHRASPNNLGRGRTETTLPNAPRNPNLNHHLRPHSTPLIRASANR